MNKKNLFKIIILLFSAQIFAIPELPIFSKPEMETRHDYRQLSEKASGYVELVAQQVGPVSTLTRRIQLLIPNLNELQSLKQFIFLGYQAYTHYKRAYEVFAEEQKQEQAEQKATLELQKLEQMLSAFQVKFVASISQELYSRVLQRITQLEIALSFWYKQQRSPMRYFLSKLPNTWLDPQKPAEEVAQIIGHLLRVREQQFRLLGLLATHADSFTLSLTSEEQCEWIAQFVAIMHEYCQNDRTWTPPADAQSLIKLSKLVFLELKKVKDAERTYRIVIDPLKPAHHVIRNWIPYSLAALFAAGSTVYIASHPHEVAKFVQDLCQGMKDNYTNLVVNRFTTLKKTFWDPIYSRRAGDTPPAPLGEVIATPTPPVSTEDKIKKMCTNIRNIFEKPSEVVLPAGMYEDEKRKTQERYRKVLGEVINKYNLNHLKPHLDTAVDGLDLLFLLSVFEASGPKQKDSSSKRYVLISQCFNIWESISNTHNVTKDGVPIGKLIFKAAAIKAYEKCDSAIEAINTFESLMIEKAKQADTLMLDTRQLLDSNKATLAVTAALPAGAFVGGVSYGIIKLVSCLLPKPCNFKLFKMALDQIANILLDAEHIGMDTVLFGQLLYYAHVLFKETVYIPEKDRGRLLEQISYLTSPYLSTEMKYQYVLQMYRDYEIYLQRASK